MRIAPQFKDEDGRRTATATHNGGSIEVVAGYDIGEDKYRYHVYVTGKTGQREKAYVGIPYAQTLDEAIEAGFQVGIGTLGG